MLPLQVRPDQGPPLAPLAWGTENTFERVQGWLKRESVAEGEGLLIRPCASIHTLGMRFPIDVAFLDRGGRVVKLAHRVPPARLVWGPWKSLFMPWGFQVLELPAGSLEAAGIRVAQRLDISQRSLP
jgi:uncharacterized membrane protein (UPF0127 family)